MKNNVVIFYIFNHLKISYVDDFVKKLPILKLVLVEVILKAIYFGTKTFMTGLQEAIFL